MSSNDITGDRLTSKVSKSDAFQEGWEKIFGKKNIEEGKKEALLNSQEVKIQKEKDGK